MSVEMRLSIAWLVLLGCGGTPAGSSPSRPLGDDALEAFGAAPAGPVEAEHPQAETDAIELAGGETFSALVALVHFDAGDGTAPQCALYALEAGARGLAEGRLRVGCDASGPDVDVPLAPVEEDRAPRLRRALAGASLTAAEPGEVQLWLTTDRRLVSGTARSPRWPSPDGSESETPVARSPENLSELWEAVMYPHRYQP